MRSPKRIGDECPGGSGSFHTRFFVGPNSVGTFAAVDTPENLTRQLQGSDRIYVEATGPEQSIAGKIKEIEGVLRVESHKLDGSDAFSYNVETELKKDVRGRLARKIVESGFDLLEMRTISMSLEEVFLQLTTKEEGVRSK